MDYSLRLFKFLIKANRKSERSEDEDSRRMRQNIPWGSELLRLLEECRVVQHVPGGQTETDNPRVSFGILFLNPDNFCNVEDQSQAHTR